MALTWASESILLRIDQGVPFRHHQEKTHTSVLRVEPKTRLYPHSVQQLSMTRVTGASKSETPDALLPPSTLSLMPCCVYS